MTVSNHKERASSFRKHRPTSAQHAHFLAFLRCPGRHDELVSVLYMQSKSASILPIPETISGSSQNPADYRPIVMRLSSAAGITPQLLKSVDVIFNTIAVIHAHDRREQNCFVKLFPTGTFIRVLITVSRLQGTKHCCFPTTHSDSMVKILMF